MDGSFGLGVGVARRRVQVVGRGTTTGVWRVQLAAIRGASSKCGAFLQQLADLQTTSGPWRWSCHQAGADTQALGKRWTLSFACSATVPEV